MPFFKNQPTFKVALCIFNQTPFTTQLSPKLTSALLSAVCPHRESSAGAPKARQAVPDLAPCLPSSRLGTVSGRHTSHQLWPAVCHLQARTRYITQYIYIYFVLSRWCCYTTTHKCTTLLCVILRGDVRAPHRHAHHPQRGRPRLRGRARQQLGPRRQRPRWQAPLRAAEDHPDATPRLHARNRAVSDYKLGGHSVTAVTFHPEVICQELNKLLELWRRFGDFMKAPEGAAMSCRRAFHKTEWENICQMLHSSPVGKDRMFQRGKNCSV